MEKKNSSGKVDVIFGLQWGDEGKGKEIDAMLSGYNSVIRFQGADNAGHSYMFNGVSIIGHLMPSGALHEKVDLIIGNGVVVNPLSLKKEVDDLKSKGIDVLKRLYISERAKIVTYMHPFVDGAGESRMGKSCIGSTLRGVGPAYKDFKARQILLIGDMLRPDFDGKLANFLEFQRSELEMYSSMYKCEIPWAEIDEKKKEWLSTLEWMKSLNICDVSELVRKKLADGKNILAEGAQGVMLDCDFGDYPFVTSSNTLPANVCLGIGVPHQALGKIYGVIKAYTTKVGGGSFPSRIRNEKVEKLFQEAGHEFGATTGRPRMCGWLDLVALKRDIYLSGATGLFINKADICPVNKIKIVVGYLGKERKKIEGFPLHLEDIYDVETVEFEGWGEKARNVIFGEDLPSELVTYIKYIENEIAPFGVKIELLGTGPERGQFAWWDW